MTHLEHALTFSLPAWLGTYAATYGPVADLAERMRFVVVAAARNVAEGTGGPFAAAVLEQDSGRLLALGVNLVTAEQLSVLHAEIVALSLAQRRIGGFDLGAPGLPAHQLVTSTEPCAMCFGAIPWSGVRHVVTGARDGDARAIGFDEGPKPADWVGALEARGIGVTTDVLRDEAREVLLAYREGGGEIYNARGGESS
jgi:tRNA(Arg) A34 adenosine deaminase TadA